MKKQISKYLAQRFVKILGVEIILFLIFSILSLFINSIKVLVAVILSSIFLTCLIMLILYFIKSFVSKSNRKMFFYCSLAISIIGLIIYSFFVFGRNMVYESDHTCYFNLQIEMTNLFFNSHLKGLYAIIKSCWLSDYSYFICVFLELMFLIIPKSHETYIIIYYFVLIVPVFVMINVFVFNIMEKLEIIHRKTFVLLCNMTLMFFPLLHFASLLGMPDIFGLFFAFAIVVLLINSDFSKYNFGVSLLLGILMVALAITRRWYIFWIVGFVPSFIILSLVFICIRDSRNIKDYILNSVRLCITVFLVVIITLFPFIYHTLIDRNYSEEYSEYYFGGFPYEIYNQIGFLGILMLILIVLGVGYGIVNSRCRVLALSCVFGGLITLWSYTLIQNMGKHQSLCLVSYYLIFLFIFYTLIDKIKNSIVRYAIIGMVVLIFAVNVFSTVFGLIDNQNGIYLTTKYAVSRWFTWKWIE